MSTSTKTPAADPDTARAGDASGAGSMTRSGAALASSSMITAALGFVFWLLAANTIEPEDLGVASAIVATTVMLANLATLGLRNALIRFLPVAGRNPRRLVRAVAMLTIGVSVLLSAAFALTARWWSDELAVLSDRPLAGVLFVAGCAAWTGFVIQDSMLIGLGRAVLVPTANAVFAATRLGVLALAAAWGTWAVPLAWSIPALLVAIPMSGVIGAAARRRARHAALDEAIGDARPPEATPRAIAAFAGADFVADSVRFLSIDVLVLVILTSRDAETTAYFYMATTIAATGQFIAAGMTAAFVATASSQPEQARALALRTIRNIAVVLTPAICAGLILAPVVLSWFGEEYRAAATGLLRLLLIDLVPLTALTVALGWARYERRLGRIAGVATLIALGPLLGVVTLGDDRSLTWIGWVAIIVHSSAAIGMLWAARSSLSPSPAARHSAAQARGAIRHCRRTRAVATVLDEFDASGGTQNRGSVRRRVIPTEADVAVVVERTMATSAPGRTSERIDPLEASPSNVEGRVLKVALSAAGERGLRAHRAALSALVDECRSSSNLEASRRTLAFVPELLDDAEVADAYVSAESALPGYSAVDRLDALPAAAAAFHAMHAATAKQRAAVDQAMLTALVRTPISSLGADRRLWPWLAELHAIEAQLVAALDHQVVVACRMHGDCWLGNVLVDDSGHGTAVVGVIDWENSIARGIADVDLAHLWLSAQPGELGIEAAHWLGTPASRRPDWWKQLELSGNPSLSLPLGMTLGWLHHVANGLERAERFGVSRRWIGQNVLPMIAALTANEVLARELSSPPANGYLQCAVLDPAPPTEAVK